MITGLDTEKSFLRARFTLISAVEAFLDPVVALLTLQACLAAFGHLLTPRYALLGVVAFSLLFPSKVGFHEAPRRVLRKIFANWLVFVMILAMVEVLTGYLAGFHRSVLIAWALLTPFAQLAFHALLRLSIPWLLRWLKDERLALVVGVNEVGVQLMHQIAGNPHLHTRVAGFFDDRHAERLHELVDTPMLGSMNDMPAYAKQHGVNEIYLALPMASQPRIMHLLEELKDTTASVFFVPDIFMTDLIQGQMTTVGPMPVMVIRDTPFYGAHGAVKRACDIVISALALLVGAPLLAVLAVAVKLSSPGPVIFKQRRYGLDGREILVYKFRSMTTTDNGADVKQATRDDARITRLGAFMRKTSLDELPQFVNVLQGRMSIVGPRPHAVAHNETYRKLVTGYMVRHKVKPGITGWAQVNGYRGETDTVEKMRKRIEYDLEYLRSWSLGFDLWIMVKTAFMVLNDKKAY